MLISQHLMQMYTLFDAHRMGYYNYTEQMNGAMCCIVINVCFIVKYEFNIHFVGNGSLVKIDGL